MFLDFGARTRMETDGRTVEMQLENPPTCHPHSTGKWKMRVSDAVVVAIWSVEMLHARSRT